MKQSIKSYKRQLLLFMCCVFATCQSFAITGIPNAHDPSPIVKDGNTYWMYATSFPWTKSPTANGIYTAYSTDLINWTPGKRIYDGTWPAWINTYVPKFGGNFWAPHIVFMNGKYYMYYACSSWGTFNCTIGVATSPTLDQNSPNYKWTDLGMVVKSSTNTEINTIDPTLFLDTDGRAYLTYGTFNGGGASVVEIDPKTGKIKAGATPKFSVYRVEGSTLFKHDNYYYLIGNRGKCCSGLASTYYFIMGRSLNPTGPFLDQNEKDLVNNGAGTTLLSSSGKYLGPGQFGIYTENGTSFISMHYYDGNDAGVAKLDIATIGFKNGWPFITRDWLPNGSYSIINKNSNKAWEATGCTGAANSAIFQNTIANTNCQKWNLTSLGNGYYSITSALAGARVAEVVQCATTNGAKIQLGNATNSACQKFKLDRAADGSYVLSPSNIMKLLEVPQNGVQFDIADYNGSNSQKWTIVPFGTVVTELEDVENVTNEAVCYPNPFLDEFHIQAKSEFDYSIYDMTGVLVEKGAGSDSKYVGSELRSGMYVVRIQTATKAEVIKITKN